jgi:hypothetical protein
MGTFFLARDPILKFRSSSKKVEKHKPKKVPKRREKYHLTIMPYPEKDPGQDLDPTASHDENGSAKSSLNQEDNEKKENAYEQNKEIEDISDDPGLQPTFNITSDLEAAPELEKQLSKISTQPTDPFLVAWDGADDPLNPRNWSFRRKWAAVFIVSLFTFIAPVTSSIVAPALSAVAKDIGITRDFESQMVMSIYVLAYAFGPLFFGPCSEIWGRVRVLQGSNVMYIAFNLACGFANTTSQLLAFRFLAGFGGSAMIALGGGILADCFTAVSFVDASLYLCETSVLTTIRRTEGRPSVCTCWDHFLGQH